MQILRDETIDLSQCRVTLILNGKAGKKDARTRLEEIRACLEPRVRALELRPVRRGSEIAATARRAVLDGTEIVAALGGDGTQAAVADALAGSGAVMAVLPGGTFNYFARELGVETMESALAAIAGGRVAGRDIGRVNDRVFLNNASIGLYPRILQSREDIYRRWGRSRIAAYWSVLVGLRNLRRPMRLCLTADGMRREVHTPLAFVARSAFQLETLGLDGAEACRQGRFALFVARGQSRGALVLASLRLALGQVARGEDFDLILAETLEIDAGSRRRIVALDGERARLMTPLQMQVQRGALRVMVPVAEPAGGT